MPHRLRLEISQQIPVFREKGHTIREIASILDIGRTTVKRYLRYPEYPRVNRPNRKWDRENRLGVHINGKYHKIRVKKRPYPEACEMDGRENIQLQWHHWDNEHPEYGLWLCGRCHKFAEGLEKGLTVAKYKELKEWAERNSIGPLKKLETLTVTGAH